MKKSRFTDEQFVPTFRESEAGTTNAELHRKHGNSNNTYTIGGQFKRARLERQRLLRMQSTSIEAVVPTRSI